MKVDPNDPRVAGARTTVTQTMTLTGILLYKYIHICRAFNKTAT